MDKQRFDSQLDSERMARRRSDRLALMLGVSTLLLALHTVTHVSREKTILVPPDLRESVWVQGDQMSPAYLESMGRYFTNLMLTYSPASVSHQKDVVLRYTDPSAHGALDAKLTGDAAGIQRDRISEVFFEAQSRTRPQSLEVALTGDLVTLVGSQQTGNRRATYVIKFTNRDGQLFVASFTEAANENDPFGDHSVPGAVAAAP